LLPCTCCAVLAEAHPIETLPASRYHNSYQAWSIISIANRHNGSGVARVLREFYTEPIMGRKYMSAAKWPKRDTEHC